MTDLPKTVTDTCRALARRHLRGKDARQDLEQDLLVIALSALATYDASKGASLLTYVYPALIRTCYASVTRSREPVIDPATVAETMDETLPDPWSALANRRDAERVSPLTMRWLHAVHLAGGPAAFARATGGPRKTISERIYWLTQAYAAMDEYPSESLEAIALHLELRYKSQH